MAGLATSRLPVGSSLAHALGKLPFMRIGVTRNTVQVLPFVDRRKFVLDRDGVFVAIGADDGQVAAS